ncbi:MAG: hypothetical protein ACO3S5_05100 [Ilumatobacteraceae bacterium]
MVVLIPSSILLLVMLSVLVQAVAGGALPGNERAARKGGSGRTSAVADVRYRIMMIEAAVQVDVTPRIQSRSAVSVNASAVRQAATPVHNLWDWRGWPEKFCESRHRPADNPVYAEIRA